MEEEEGLGLVVTSLSVTMLGGVGGVLVGLTAANQNEFTAYNINILLTY